MRYLACSKKWRSDYRLGKRNIYGHSYFKIHSEIPDKLKEAYREALKGRVQFADSDLFYINKQKHWVKWEVTPWYVNSQEIGGVSIISSFVSDEVNEKEKKRYSKFYRI